MKRKSVLKCLKIAMHTAWWGFIALLVVLLFTIIGAKINGQVPKLFGYSVMHIISDSMEPAIKKDSYILIKETDANKIKKDDIICFYSPDPLIYGLPNTHRVISEPKITENGIIFETRGDKNLISDKHPVEEDMLIGVYVDDLPALSSFSRALDGGLSIVLIVIIQIGVIAVAVITAVTAKKNKKEIQEN